MGNFEAMLEAVKNPGTFSIDSFEEAKEILKRCRSGEMSVSFSGAEYYTDEIEYIFQRMDLMQRVILTKALEEKLSGNTNR